MLTGPTQAGDWDTQWQGNAQLQNRAFLHGATGEQNDQLQYSYALTPQLKASAPSGDQVLSGKLFYRKDFTDSVRTHWDIRELKFDQRLGDTVVTWGVDSVFWGKTESQNLVDIINQHDGVEGVFTDEKLGQPMVRVRHVTEAGVLEAYYLPYSRQATYAGSHGRLRTMPGIDGDRAQYREGAQQWYPGAALRWEPDVPGFDLGLSMFHGLSRDPSFSPIDHNGEPWFAPVYGAITQVGIDTQYVTEQTLYKLEAIYRQGQLDLTLAKRNYAAVTLGLEHTLGGFMQGRGDLGLILEYNRDGMGRRSINSLQDDVVLGIRYSLNDVADTYLLATVALDRIYGSRLYKAELTRRLGESFKLSGELFVPTLNDDQEFIYGYRRDAVATTSISYYW
jgi:hypothetical protein